MSEKLCEYCKINPATNHHVRQTKEGEVKAYYCLACYRKVKAAEESQKTAAVSAKGKTARCPNCGCTVEQFKKRNLVGCAHCYKALSWAIEPIIERMQGTAPHCGRQENLDARTRLMRRYNEVGVIRDNLLDKSQEEAYDEEMRRIQSLLSSNKEEV